MGVTSASKRRFGQPPTNCVATSMPPNTSTSFSAEVAHKEKLKTKLAALEAVVGADRRIRLVAEDLVRHWEARFEAMEGKAMIVSMSRRICVELYEALKQLRPEWHHEDDDKGAMKVVMTGSADDGPKLAYHAKNKARR